MKVDELYKILFDDLHLVNSALGMIKEYKLYYTTSIEPDYYLSGSYDGLVEKHYYFRGYWDFDFDFFKLFSVSIVRSFFVMDGIKKRICDVCPVTQVELGGIKNITTGEYINSYFECNPDKEDFSEFDEFIFDMGDNYTPHLSAINVDSINNNLKKIIYSGSFYSSGIDHANAVEVVCELHVTGAKKRQYFYLELLVEAYALLIESNFKMSFFMSYAALESYINDKINGQNVEERFQDKFKKAYDTVPKLRTHETFSKLKKVLGGFTSVRNTIAHGRDNDEVIDNVGEKSAKEIYIFVAAVILAIENNLEKIKDIERYIKPRRSKE
ncbi:hypothetical protein [Pectobacterium cacticida]|uniref:hypothetical protein n=1 Tax=Pectobacterium cacticida TaxID=69221 RepID=UPI00398747EA